MKRYELEVGSYVKVNYRGYILRAEIISLDESVAKVKIPTYYGTKEPIFKTYSLDQLIEYK